MISREKLNKLREDFPKGTRIKLIKMDDPQAPPLGCLGTIESIDDIGSLVVRWDNGSRLRVVYEEDKVEKVD